MPARKSLVGQLFTRLEVVADGPDYVRKDGKVRARSWCRCKCGRPDLVLVLNDSLISLSTKSCRCLRREIATIHGQAKLRTGAYRSWEDMMQRATNLHHPEAKYYTDQGVTVCAGLKSFPGFFEVLGERPEKKMIDRWPDRDGNYSCGKCAECLQKGWPLNVRWATIAESNRNKRDTRLFEICGVKGCMKDLAKHFKISYDAVRKRLRLGWPPQRAFTEPINQSMTRGRGRSPDISL